MGDEQGLQAASERWRDEVSSRVDTYRRKRSKSRLSGDFSMRFEFDESPWRHSTAATAPTMPPYTGAISNDDEEVECAPTAEVEESAPAPAAPQPAVTGAATVAPGAAPALESSGAKTHDAHEAVVGPEPDPVVYDQNTEQTAAAQACEQTFAPEPQSEPETLRRGTVIEFPRFAFMTETPRDELAEPVLDRPRILDVPESTVEPQADPSPLADLSATEQVEETPQTDFEIPPQVAPIPLRVAAAIADCGILLAATAIFAAVAWKIAPGIPHTKVTAVMLAVVPVIFWSAYQYLFLVHGRGTVGMCASRLALRTFEHEPARRSQRRARALTQLISFASLGLGFMWALADDDTLCWHDRMSRTYLSHE